MCIKGGPVVCLLLTLLLLNDPLAEAQTFSRVTDPPFTATAKATACAWGDFNNDGYLDLFVANSTDAPSFIFINRGSYGFVHSTLPDPWAQGGAWGDFNNDGHLDLARTISGIGGGLVIHSNNGNGTFTAADVSHLSRAPVWVDYDLDGNLDVAVVDYPYNADAAVYIYRREPDGFRRLPTQFSGSAGGAAAPVWGNMSSDLFPDLFVCNSYAANQLYLNPA